MATSRQMDQPQELDKGLCLYHQMKKESTHRGTIWLQFMAWVSLMAHIQDSN